MGSPFCKHFLTINDLYNGAKIVNLPLAVVDIRFCKIVFNLENKNISSDVLNKMAYLEKLSKLVINILERPIKWKSTLKL